MDGSGGIGGVAENHHLRLGGDCGSKVGGINQKVVIDHGGEDNGGGPSEGDHLRIRGPEGGGDDHFIARAAEGKHALIDRLLCTIRDKDLCRLVG